MNKMRRKNRACAGFVASVAFLAIVNAECRDSGPTINPSRIDQRPRVIAPKKRPVVRSRAIKVTASKPWKKGGRSLIAEMHVDEKSGSVLLRVLTFKGRCLPFYVYSKVPAACTPKSWRSKQQPPMSMRVALRRFKLSDGSEIAGRIGPAARMLRSDHPADEAVVDYRGRSLLRVINGRRSLEHYQGKRVSRWSAPKGQRLEDAKILNRGTRVIIATGKYGRRSRLKGMITVWDSKSDQVVTRIGVKVKQKLYIKMITTTMAAEYYHITCLRGHADMCRRGKKVMVFGRGLRRPNRIRLALSDDDRLLAAYAYGDLFIYDISSTTMVLRHHIVDAFYQDRNWYILKGSVDVSGDSRQVAIFGRSGLVRIVNTNNGAISSRITRWNTSHAFHSGHASAASYDSQGGSALWIAHSSVLSRIGKTGREKDEYRLIEGLFLREKELRGKVQGDEWGIEKIAVTKRRLIVMARGRVVIFDKKRLKVEGMFGVSSSVSVSSDIMWGQGVKWFGSWRGM